MSVQIKTGRKYKVAASIPERPGARVVQQGPPGPPGPPGQDSTVPGPPGAAGGFGTPTASATGLAEGQPPTVAIADSGPDTAKVFDFEFGIPAGATGQTGQTGETGPAGADGAAAGFDTPSASASGLAPGASPTANVVASGPDTAKQFDFSFGIPAGAQGQTGPTGPAGTPGAAAGFGTPSASASGLAPGATPTASVAASGPDTAKVFDFTLGIPAGAQGQTGQTGPAGSPGAPGAAAGFGTPSASASGLAAGAAPTASVSASGPDTAKVFDFALGIPAGATGSQGPAGQPGQTGPPGPPATVGPTAPADPEIGEFWIDNSGSSMEPITSLAYHITALKQAGAAAIWPLDDPTVSSGQRVEEATGGGWALRTAGGTPGLAGPYGENTAYEPPQAATTQSPYVNLATVGEDWPPTVGQPQMTICWWMYMPDAGPPAPWFLASLLWQPSTPSSQWQFFWGGLGGGNQWMGGSTWQPQGNVISLSNAQFQPLSGRWAHYTLVLDNTQIRLYIDGQFIAASAALSPAPATSVPSGVAYWQNNAGSAMRYQAIALFDRALTGPEVDGLLHSDVPVPTHILRVWDGSQWQLLDEPPIPDPLTLHTLEADEIIVANDVTQPSITSGNIAPNTVQPAGSLYLRTDTPTIPGQRLYWNPNGAAGGWTAIDTPPVTTGPPAAPGTYAGQVQADTVGGLWVWDGTYWRPVGGQRYHATVSRSTGQVLNANGSWQRVMFDTVSTNPGGGFVQSTSIYWAPIPGRYLISANVSFVSSPSASVRLRVNQPGGSFITGSGTDGSAAGFSSHVLSAISYTPTVSQQMYLEVYVGSAGGTVTTEPWASMEIAYLGPLG